ncbi:MAG: DedA family protein [Alicyclobacillus shizuokensis]|nr:DedA family protein [Alicyclobacillus shizuokensis]
MHFDIQEWLQHYGYFGVLLILLLEPIGIPFPAETTLTVAGIEWTRGVFHLLPLWLAAVVGNVTGSTAAYAIGRYLGRPVIVRFGRHVGITQTRLDAAANWFNRYQGGILLVSKFIAGIRVLVPYVAGIENMSLIRFSLYNVFGTLVWTVIFIVLGRTLGVEWARYHHLLEEHRAVMGVALIVLVAVLVSWRVYRRRKSA